MIATKSPFVFSDISGIFLHYSCTIQKNVVTLQSQSNYTLALRINIPSLTDIKQEDIL